MCEDVYNTLIEFSLPVKIFSLIKTCLNETDSKDRTGEYEGGPKNKRNLNVARELEVVPRCAARCRNSTQYSSSLPRGVDLG